MGCSNPHPHCQICASSVVPTIVQTERERQEDFVAKACKPLLLDYLESELAKQERVVDENGRFVVLVPFWAVWPFETIILPKRYVAALDTFTPDEVTAFADAYRTLTRAYDNVLDCEFPYTAGIHRAPAVPGDHRPGSSTCTATRRCCAPPLSRNSCRPRNARDAAARPDAG